MLSPGWVILGDCYLQEILSDRLLLRLSLAILSLWVKNHICQLGNQDLTSLEVPTLSGAWKPWEPGEEASFTVWVEVSFFTGACENGIMQ